MKKLIFFFLLLFVVQAFADQSECISAIQNFNKTNAGRAEIGFLEWGKSASYVALRTDKTFTGNEAQAQSTAVVRTCVMAGFPNHFYTGIKGEGIKLDCQVLNVQTMAVSCDPFKMVGPTANSFQFVSIK